MRRAFPLVLTGLLLPSVLVACGGDDGAELTIYSGRTSELIKPLLDRFASETGTRIAVKWGDSAELALIIDSEGDRSPADVFISQSPGAMDYLSTRDRLEALGEETLAAVPPQFESDTGQWVGLSGRARTLVYNTDLVAEADLPTSVLDLVDERYEGQVAVAPTNGSFQDFVTAMRQSTGDEATGRFLTGLADNGARSYANNNAIVQAVARGEVAMGLVNHYYNVRAKAEDPSLPTENHFFADGDLGNLMLVTGAGRVRGTDRTEAADRFIEFMLSESAQTYLSEETKEYPLAAGVAPAEGLPPLESIPAPDEDLSSLGDDLQGTVRLIQEAGLSAG